MLSNSRIFIGASEKSSAKTLNWGGRDSCRCPDSIFKLTGLLLINNQASPLRKTRIA